MSRSAAISTRLGRKMPSATAFERLAPDQRAAVELVLRQGRSYGELADLLGMPEETIRARARNGLAALAPDLPAPARAGEICDWLLGQQSPAHAARTGALLEADPAAKRWAQTVAAPLREVAGRRGGARGGRRRGRAQRRAVTLDRRAKRRERRSRRERREPRAQRRGRRDGARRADDACAARPTSPLPTATPRAGVPRGSAARSSSARRCCSSRPCWCSCSRAASDDPDPAAEATAPPATATATATPAAGANDILLKGPAGSKAVGLMRLFQANDGTVRFAIAAQGVAPNAEGQTLLAVVQRRGRQGPAARATSRTRSASNGELTSAGPGNDDVDEFPQWFADYDTILVTLDDEGREGAGQGHPQRRPSQRRLRKSRSVSFSVSASAAR